jgi:hypothetical protein
MGINPGKKTERRQHQEKPDGSLQRGLAAIRPALTKNPDFAEMVMASAPKSVDQSKPGLTEMPAVKEAAALDDFAKRMTTPEMSVEDAAALQRHGTEVRVETNHEVQGETKMSEVTANGSTAGAAEKPAEKPAEKKAEKKAEKSLMKQVKEFVGITDPMTPEEAKLAHRKIVEETSAEMAKQTSELKAMKSPWAQRSKLGHLSIGGLFA